MNILIISKYISVRKYGQNSRISIIAQEFVKKGHNVKVISSDSNHFGNWPKYKNIYNHETINKVNYCWIKTYKYKSSASISRILSWLDFELKLFFYPNKNVLNTDQIIVSSLSLITIINGLILKRKLKCKLTFEVRDIWPLTMVEEANYNKSNFFVKVLGFIEKMGYKYSDFIVGTMPNLKAHVYSILKEKKEVYCIPFGVEDESKSSINNNYNAPEFIFPKDKLVIGYSGSLGISNGMDTFFEVIQQMKFNTKVHFVILGQGALKQSYIEKTKNQNNVTFFDYVVPSYVPLFLEKCDLLYFSALKSKVWDFGWSPNKIIDYMLAKKPVLCSYSGHRTMINEANSGFFVPSEDSKSLKEIILKISNFSKNELDTMGERGRKWILSNRKYSKLADDYLKILNNG
tara:strand:+ start:18574 stop:19782 length:1209 start_codon:yes stop_codon:yes gene_type:complete